MVDPGLLCQHPHHHLLAPLISSQYLIDVVNSVAHITLTQTYYNPSDNIVELDYHFPVNPKACLYKFVAEFGHKRIEGVVKEKEQATK